MITFKLKIDNSCDNFSQALGISEERFYELNEMFKSLVDRLEKENRDELSLSLIVEESSKMDITNEEFALLMFQIGRAYSDNE